jgi:SAM-dependent methyltransferase
MPTASPWILRFLPLVERTGSVLDLACGTGRHGRAFLDAGHAVTLIDRDLAGVADLVGRAELIEADLEAVGAPWPLGARRFAGVVVTNYLWRPILPKLLDAVAPGGVLLYETFAMGNERHGRPRNPDFLLRPGELLTACAGGFDVVAYEHGREMGAEHPRVVQRICARRIPGADDEPWPLPPATE